MQPGFYLLVNTSGNIQEATERPAPRFPNADASTLLCQGLSKTLCGYGHDGRQAPSALGAVVHIGHGDAYAEPQIQSKPYCLPVIVNNNSYHYC